MALATGLSQTLRQPLAWVGALATAAVGPLGPGDLVGFAVVHAAGAPVVATSRASTFIEAFGSYGDPMSLVVRWLVLATLAWVVRAPLVAATFGGDARRTLSLGFGRFVRTRAVSIMVTSAFAVVPLLGLLSLAKRTPWAWVGIALLLSVASGWAALADRFAFKRFDVAQDAVAARRRAEGRFAGPNELDTSTRRGGGGVASGADSAVTAAGWRLVTTRSMGVLAVALVLDLLRFGVWVVVPGTGSVEQMLATNAFVPWSGAVSLALATGTAMVTAALWTAAFDDPST